MVRVNVSSGEERVDLVNLVHSRSLEDETSTLCHLGQAVHRIGGKVTLGGLERWFSPRGQVLAFLLSCIGLVRPSSSADLKQNKARRCTYLGSLITV
jgi:hypothetical protein